MQVLSTRMIEGYDDEKMAILGHPPHYIR